MRALLGEYRDAAHGFDREAWSYLVAAALASVGRGSLAVLRNLYLKELGYGEDAIGWFQSAAGLGQVLVALPAVYLMGRVGYRRTLACAFAVEGASAFAQAALAAAPVFVFAGFSAGAVQALLLGVSAPFLMAHCAPRARTHLLGLAFAAGMAGSALGSTLGGAVEKVASAALGSTTAGFRVALAIAGLPYLAALAQALRLPDDGQARETAPRGLRGAALLLRVRGPGRVAALALPEVLIGFGAGLTIPFLQVYFRNTFSQGSLAIGTIFALQAAAMTAGYLAVPVVARRLGLVRTIVFTQALSIPFFLELAFPHGLGLAIAALCCRAMFMNMGSPAFSHFAQEVVHEADRRAVVSVVMLARNSAFMTANVVGGTLIAAAGGAFGRTIALTAVIYAVACTVSLVVFSRLERTKPK